MASRATSSPVLAGDGTGHTWLVGSAPSFYPGVPSLEVATPVRVEPGSAVEAVDLTVAYEPVADVDVSIVSGAVPVVQIVARQLPLHGSGAAASSTTRGDSAVTFPNVTAGHWLFTVAATLETPGGLETQWALHYATTDGLTRHRASVTLQPAARVSGRVVYDGAGQPPASMAIRLADVEGPVSFDTSAGSTGEFEFRGVLPARYAIQADSPGDGWTLGRATLNGQDLLDRPLHLAPADDVSGVVLTLTTRLTELSGVVTDAAGRPLAGTALAIVPADSAAHWPGSRRLRRFTTTTDGTYSVRGLPPGEYRIGPAPVAWTGAALLQFPRPLTALAITLADGERQTRNLTLSR